ncbi:hypothetical protein E3C22_06630 [Jiella endophytica]|uniref:Uncharacterized protein n=1 Tax=Jiella endophytica TaxID=2558362 RepID=A0A4Y8RN30_9HYPH|nr:protealysin inhibitor emfourin [Jiella endophytica]TFF25053.1 hypothetical protein E3C22_06630 [Jiella endophytica]
MIVKITSSGGLPGMGIDKTIDGGRLPAAMQAKLQAAFDPAVLRRLEQATPHPGAADMHDYRVTVTDDSGAVHRFKLSEASMPAETLDLIDDL